MNSLEYYEALRRSDMQQRAMMQQQAIGGLGGLGMLEQYMPPMPNPQPPQVEERPTGDELLLLTEED